MPELPEVETIRRTLLPLLVGRRIADVVVTSPDVVGRPAGDAGALRASLVGRRFLDLDRRGKYLLFRLTAACAAEGAGADGDPVPPWEEAVLVWHLRMTGRLVVVPSEAPVEPHTHVRVALEGGGELRYRDVRRFGRAYAFRLTELAPILQRPGRGEQAVAPGRAGRVRRARAVRREVPPGLCSLGPEPFDEGFAQALAAALSGRRSPIKSLLLDQRVVAGVGNIYADEALFLAGIHPHTPAGTLAPWQVERLAAALREVMERSLAHGGTTLRDYVDGRGVPGEMARHLAVYGRAGQPCRRCGTPIERDFVGTRSTCFCPLCQPRRA